MDQPIACTLTPGEYQRPHRRARRAGGPRAALARADRRRRAADLRRQPRRPSASCAPRSPPRRAAARSCAWTCSARDDGPGARHRRPAGRPADHRGAVRVSVPEKLLGAGALVMALCCALLPLAGAALGGGLIAGAGTIGADRRRRRPGRRRLRRHAPAQARRPDADRAAATAAVGKELVRRLVDEVVNAGDMRALERSTRRRWRAPRARWIKPFRPSFPDFRDGDRPARCRRRHRRRRAFAARAPTSGEWRGHAPTGRRFERVDEVYISRSATGASPAPGALKTPRVARRNSACPASRTCALQAKDSGAETLDPVFFDNQARQ